MKFSRRAFLGSSGVALVGAGLSGCTALEQGHHEEYGVEKPPVPGAEGWAPGEERFTRSACLQCEGGCGIVVRVVEGRAVKIEGNPDFPTNQGGLCPKGLNGLQALYDPDRLKGPLRRDGKRGEGRWRPVTWDEAIGDVSRELGNLRSAGEAHALAILGGRYRGHMRALARRFLQAYGSPNDLDHESLCSTGDKLAHELSQGIHDRFAYDWERTRYILSFGAGLFESFRPTAMMLRIHGLLRRGRPGERAKIVQIDPRLGVTASRADEWVQVEPGTDGALALGIAHVLIREKLYDEAFVRERTFGFEDWTDEAGRKHRGFRALVLSGYDPASVSKITHVPSETIERIAREFAGNRPAIAVAGRGVAAHANGVGAVRAVHALNALAGSIDVPGGVLVQRHPPFAEWPDPEIDDVARRGLSKPRIGEDPSLPFGSTAASHLIEHLERGDPYALKALFVYYTNPLFSAPAPDRLRSALERVPLIVSFSPFMDESTAMADLVLPDHTYLERWQIEEPPPSVGFPLFSIRQPVVAPLHDTMSTGEALIRIAQGIGGSVAGSFPETEKDMIRDLVRGVQQSGRGSIQAADFDEFWDKLIATGGWWDGPYAFGRWEEVMPTPTGKYEFFSKRLEEELKQRGGEDAFAARLGLEGDDVFLPHYQPVNAPAIRSPAGAFRLCSYKTMTHAEGRGANQPHLQELFGVQFDRCWEPWVEMHPEDARALGIADNDFIWLVSETGRARVRAVLQDGVPRGMVCHPFEYGHTAYGRWAAGRGANINRLIAEPGVEPFGGNIAWYDARISIERADGQGDHA